MGSMIKLTMYPDSLPPSVETFYAIHALDATGHREKRALRASVRVRPSPADSCFDRRGGSGGESARDPTTPRARAASVSFEPAISRSHGLTASVSQL